jgi:hypothetical protein
MRPWQDHIPAHAREIGTKFCEVLRVNKTLISTQSLRQLEQAAVLLLTQLLVDALLSSLPRVVLLSIESSSSSGTNWGSSRL